jgi:hypothetical protein
MNAENKKQTKEQTKNESGEDVTPHPKGYFGILWLIATESTVAEDRLYAKRKIMEGFLAGVDY